MAQATTCIVARVIRSHCIDAPELTTSTVNSLAEFYGQAGRSLPVYVHSSALKQPNVIDGSDSLYDGIAGVMAHHDAAREQQCLHVPGVR